MPYYLWWIYFSGDRWLPPIMCGLLSKGFFYRRVGKALYVHARLFHSTTHYLKKLFALPASFNLSGIA